MKVEAIEMDVLLTSTVWKKGMKTFTTKVTSKDGSVCNITLNFESERSAKSFRNIAGNFKGFNVDKIKNAVKEVVDARNEASYADTGLGVVVVAQDDWGILDGAIDDLDAHIED